MAILLVNGQNVRSCHRVSDIDVYGDKRMSVWDSKDVRRISICFWSDRIRSLLVTDRLVADRPVADRPVTDSAWYSIVGSLGNGVPFR